MKNLEEVLSAPLTEDELEARGAGYYPSRIFDMPDGRTVVAWTYGLACAMPKADVIAFVIPARHWLEAGIACEDKPADNRFVIVPVRWKKVVRFLGERWERRFKRYCVRPESFPKPDELRILSRHMIPQPVRS